MDLISLGLSPPERRSTNEIGGYVGSFANWEFLRGGPDSEAAEIVTSQTAMQQATTNACVRLISESIASMSPILFEKVGDGKTEAFAHPLHDILSVEANTDCSAFTLWDSFVGSIALTGNGYLEISRNGAGIIDGLWFLHPHLTTVTRKPNGLLSYRTGDGMAAGQFRDLPATSVVHVPWFSLNSVTGISVIEQARTAVGKAIAEDKYGARFFRNNATPSGILSITKKVRPEEKPQIRADWEAQQLGGNQHRISILDQETTFTPITMSNEDSQFLASRNMSRQEICGLFRIHPSQIGDTSRVAGETFAGQQLGFLTDCLRPWLNRIEQELTRKLLRGLPGYSISHDISDRLRTDFKTQMDGFAVGRQWGFFTANQVRKELGENPIPGAEGDAYLVPANMMNAERLLDPPKTTTVTGVENV